MKKIFSILFIASLFIGCKQNDKKRKVDNNTSFRLVSTNSKSIDSLSKLDCKEIISLKKDSITLDVESMINYSTEFVSQSDTSLTASLIMNINPFLGDLNLIYINLKGNYGCIDSRTKILFINKDDRKIEFECHNEESICADSPLLVFSLPLTTDSDNTKLLMLPQYNRIRIIKNATSYIELTLNENDIVELMTKIVCLRKKMRNE